MKRLGIIAYFILFIQIISFAQIPTTTTPTTAPPDFQNPFTNPYGNNPSNPNILNPNGTTTPPPNGTTTTTTNNNNTQNTDVDQPIPNKDFSELYKNDPDYLKYLGQQDLTKPDSLLPEAILSADIGANSKIYGGNFLNAYNGQDIDLTPSTVPFDYRLGSGDELIVTIWGTAELQKQLTINSDGSIFSELIGKVFLRGMTFEAAKKIIISRYRQRIPAGAQIDVSISKVRTIRINLVGEINRPGVVLISAFQNVFNAIRAAGGITANGDMRDIKIIRNGYVIEHIDLYQYLQTGQLSSSIYLEDNDFISIGLYKKVVEAKGQFKRPMFYQLNEFETLNDLIQLAGGASFDARQSFIRIKTIEDEKEKYIEFDGNEYFSDKNNLEYVLHDGDVVILGKINEGLSNTVTIQGAVNYPDVYQIENGQRLFDVIKKAGGLNSAAYTKRVFVYRNGNSILDNFIIKSNITDLKNYEDSLNNIPMKNGDLITIMNERNFSTTYNYEILGSVEKPGKYPYKRDLRLKDVLLLAGGLDLEAESGRIEISNITDTISKYERKGKSPNVRIIAINPNLEIDKVSENILIKADDRIFVRKQKNIIEQTKVSVFGEVDYPGDYALLGKNESLTSIIKRTGGLKPEAYTEGAKLYRKNLGQIVIDLDQALKKNGGKNDIVLKDSDIIIIPQKIDVVTVKGEVQNPINVKFDREQTSAINYIDAAGGFGEKPWRRRITVQYQNGRLKRTKSFMFLNFYPKIKPGSIVNVPKRPNGNKIDIQQALQYSITTATSILTIILLTQRIN